MLVIVVKGKRIASRIMPESMSTTSKAMTIADQ
jgi:hypothetical protein